MVQVKFVNSEEDYIEASRVYSYGSKGAKLDFIIEIMAIIVGIIFFWVLGFSLIWVFLFIACILVIIIRILGYFVLSKMRYRKEPKYKWEYLMEFDDDGIRFKTKNIESKLEWSLYNKVIETEKTYILVHSNYNFRNSIWIIILADWT